MISGDALVHKFEQNVRAVGLAGVCRNTGPSIDEVVGGVIYTPTRRSRAAPFTN